MGGSAAKLTPKQEAFVSAYLFETNGDGFKAAQIAGYGTPGKWKHILASKAVRAAITGETDDSRLKHKFSRDRVDRLLRALRMGVPYRLACMHAGISVDTFENWRAGKKPLRDSIKDDALEYYDNFEDLLEQAEGDAATRHVSTIMAAAAQGDADVSLKFLSMRWPEEFGKKNADVSVQLNLELNQLIDQIADEDGLTEIERQEFMEMANRYRKGQVK